MTDRSLIKEHAEIVGSCGHHIGTVDGLDGDFIRLSGSDAEDGRRHYLPAAAIADIQDGKIIMLVNRTAALSMLQDTPEPGELGGNFASSS